MPLAAFLTEPVVPPEDDDVTRLIWQTHHAEAFAPLSHLTVGGLREWLLSVAVLPDAAQRVAAVAPGLTPEMVAAVSKLMGNKDLVAVAAANVVTAFRTTLGLPGRLATRLQPNHPADDPTAIAATVLDEIRQRYDIPFQSIAGTQGANEAFGVTLPLLAEANEAARSLRRGTVGEHVMYFETGQGSALSSDTQRGTDGRAVDQQTLEARAYGVARSFDPLLVNTVVGFIGPEYLYDHEQITRAGLEGGRGARLRPRRGARHARCADARCRAGRAGSRRGDHLASAAPDRATYLTRPDLGRVPAQPLPTGAGAVDLAVVLADGLSAEAVERHAVPVVRAPVPLLDAGTTVAPPAVATQARVALGDHVGAALKARLVLVLIGERPGLSSSDSLAGLIAGARRIGATGVRLKDPGGLVRPPGSEELH